MALKHLAIIALFIAATFIFGSIIIIGQQDGYHVDLGDFK